MEDRAQSTFSQGASVDFSKLWVHFVAIGGTGVGALAALLQDRGAHITGSDGPLYPPMSTFLAERKIPLSSVYQAKNLDGTTWGFSKTHPDLVIVGNAISKSNVEAAAVETLMSTQGIKRMSHAEALAEFGIGNRRSFVIAGTHGKTTTTALMAWAFEALAKSPGFFIGGIPKNFGFGCRLGSGAVFVSEGDEYDTAYWDKESKFLHYRPSWVLCTGIEFDHADIFKDVAAIEKMFIKLGSKTREGWLLIDQESSPRPESTRIVASQLKEQGVKVLRYGIGSNADYRLLSSKPVDLKLGQVECVGTELHLKCPELGTIVLKSPMTGSHNALNLLGVVGTLLASGEVKTADELQKFLNTFSGIKRRQEEVFVSPKLVVIDDFAHHPTAIRETIDAIRNRYRRFKVAAFFEARSATSARQVMADDFAKCFDSADAIFLSPPSKTNIPEAEKLDINALVAALKVRPKNSGKTLVLEKEISQLDSAFQNWRSGLAADTPVVALVMSNGPFGGIHQLLAKHG